MSHYKSRGTSQYESSGMSHHYESRATSHIVHVRKRGGKVVRIVTSPPCQRPSLLVVGPEGGLQRATAVGVPSREGVAVMHEAWLLGDAGDVGGVAIFI